MKNHYKIIGVNQKSTIEDIKKETKNKIKLISESEMNINEKKKYIDQLSESFYILNNSNSRHELDEFIEMKNKVKSLSEDFFRVSDILLKVKEIPKIKKSDNIFYSYSSYSSSKVDKNGDVTVVNKFLRNNNGKLDGKHTITTKDKLGNDIIKEIPVNKKNFKLDYNIL